MAYDYEYDDVDGSESYILQLIVSERERSWPDVFSDDGWWIGKGWCMMVDT